MLGSLAEAEDAVQDAWLRLNRSDTDEVGNLSGWLTTVVARICLDACESASRAAKNRPARIRPNPRWQPKRTGNANSRIRWA